MSFDSVALLLSRPLYKRRRSLVSRSLQFLHYNRFDIPALNFYIDSSILYTIILSEIHVDILKMNPRIGVGVFVFNNQGQFLIGKRKGSHGSGMPSSTQLSSIKRVLSNKN